MLLSRIPQQVSNCLAPLSSHFKTRPQGQHFRILCWLLVVLILVQGSAALKNLTLHLPRTLHYWTVLRRIKAGYWDASALITEFEPPSWAGEVIVVANAGFASKDNLRLIIRRRWKFVFALPRTWKLTDGTHLRDLTNHLPKSNYRRVASYKPDQHRKDYWVFIRRARLKTLGDVTILWG
jgi:hypothetical protein